MEFEVVKEQMFGLIVCCKTCTSQEDLEKLQEAVQEKHIAGTTGGWQLAQHRDDFRVQCASDPEKSHYLFAC